jgi:hypothetical protein
MKRAGLQNLPKRLPQAGSKMLLRQVPVGLISKARQRLIPEFQLFTTNSTK